MALARATHPPPNTTHLNNPKVSRAGAYAKLELLTMGLFTADELGPDARGTYCEDPIYVYDKYAAMLRGFSCGHAALRSRPPRRPIIPCLT